LNLKVRKLITTPCEKVGQGISDLTVGGYDWQARPSPQPTPPAGGCGWQAIPSPPTYAMLRLAGRERGRV